MNNFTKNIILLSFLAVLIFIPVLKANATEVYVGVQITTANAPGCSGAGNSCGGPAVTDTSYCLPPNSTMNITDTGGNTITPISPTLNPVTLNQQYCAGSTIWSGLLNLTPGNTYKAMISVPNPQFWSASGFWISFGYCPGLTYNSLSGYTCLVPSVTGANCTTTCANYSLTNTNDGSTGCWTLENASDNCLAEKSLGTDCSGGCTTGAPDSYFNPSTNACSSRTSGATNFTPCSTTYAGLKRVCACNITSAVGSNINFNYFWTYAP